MKFTKYLIYVSLLFSTTAFGQQQEVSFLHQNINFSAAPRTTISPMSIKLWDNYQNGGPTSYGTVLEIYGRSGHQTGQFYFAGWDNSKIRYREAFYDQNNWSDWMTLLDSKNNVESTGLLMISGQGNHYIKEGNVGIGTTAPNEKLSVNGKIRAQEIKVEATNWPDYVFQKDYQLPSLAETEKHIRENGHLPGIPSAAEVKTNGVDLGEMDAKLLQKIEELTLHLINKEKQIEEVQNKLAKQDGEFQKQKEELARINKLIEQLKKK